MNGQDRVGPYRLVTPPLGAAGRLWHVALDERSGSPAALALLEGVSAPLLEAMRRQFHARRGVSHPHIGRLLDEGLGDERPWYTVELHEGSPLEGLAPSVVPAEAPAAPPSSRRVASDTLVSARSELAPGPRSEAPVVLAAPRPIEPDWLRQVMRAGVEVGNALSSLHGAGLVHGSVSAGSVWRRGIDGATVLVDPGLVEPGRQVPPGLLPVLPPEVLAGEPLDGRADIFCLGWMLYSLLAGHPPGRAGAEVAPLWTITSGVPMPLARLVHRMLAPSPRQRPSHPADCALELLVFLGMDADLERPHFSSSLVRVVERPALLAQLGAALERGRGTALRLAEGVEVASTLDAVAARARRLGLEVLRVEAPALPTPLGPFTPWRAPARDEALDATEELVGGTAALAESEVAAVESALRAQPSLLVVERGERLDTLSARLLERLAVGSAGPWLLVVGGPSLAPPPGLPVVDVAGVDEAEVAELVVGMLGVSPRSVPVALTAALRGLEPRQPWAVEQRLLALIDEGCLGRDDSGVWRLREASPEALRSHLAPLRALLGRRLAALDATARALLAAAALHTQGWAIGALWAAAGLDPAQPSSAQAFEELRRRRWLADQGPDRVRLAGPWLSEPALGLLDDEARRALWLRAAEAADGSAAGLARAIGWREQAGDGGTTRLRRQAASLALRAGGPAEAMALVEPALGRDGTSPALRASLHRLMALALVEQGDEAAARQHVTASLEVLGHRAPAPGDTRPLLREALRQIVPGWAPEQPADEAAAPELARSYELLARLYRRPGEATGRALAALRALDRGGEAPTSSRRLAQVYGAVGELLERGPLQPLAARSLEQARRASERLGDDFHAALLWARQGQLALGQARWAEAERALGRAVRLARARRDGDQWPHTASLLALTWLWQGELALSRSLGRELRAGAAGLDAILAASAIEAEVALHRGLDREAADLLAPVLAPSRDHPLFADRLRGLHAVARWRLGDRSAALREAERVARAVTAPDDLLLAESLFGVLDVLAAGPAPSRQAAVPLLRSLERLARTSPALRPRLWLVEGQLGLHSPWRDPFERAIAAARRMDLPYTLALALARSGQRRHDAAAEQNLAESERLLARLQASGDEVL